ncbi:MAG: UvrD-helicase domain-containing protein [Candidatus Poribacteria bacterium]|nr:UvrD-helicase domain-containing protein [Candidatus Poribacteria bacterium]
MTTLLTREQQMAVETPANMIVTAGAGTGKTYAMTQRIIRVLASLDHIHELLVVTFTDDAASEIRQRVYQALVARIRESEGDERERLERIRDRFPENHISTMHTFFGYLLRRFPDAVAGLDPDFRITQGAEQEDLLRSSIESVLDGIATTPNSEHREDLRRWLRQQRRYEVRTAIESLIRKRLETAAWRQRFAEEAAETLLESYRAEAFDHIESAKEAFYERDDIKRIVGALEGAMPEIEDPSDSMAVELAAVIPALRDRDTGALRVMLSRNDSKPRAFGRTGTAKSWGKEHLAELRDSLTLLAEFVVTDESLTVAWDEFTEREAFDCLQSLARLTSLSIDEYDRRKARIHALDFTDLEAFAAALLDEPAILRSIQRQFRAIFIDEFQDTNRSQWALFRKLACREGSEELADNKLFLVGDEKQAIYEFRGGEVEVCQSAKAELDTRLEFTANFRSKSNLLLFFNGFFAPLLTGGEPFEAESQALRCGDAPEPPTDALHPREGGSIRHFCVAQETASRDEERLSGTEREARAIAELLRDILDGKRDSEYPGIADKIESGEPTVGILFRRTTHQRVYEDALRAYGVPFVAAKGKGFYERNEIRDLRNVLTVLTDKHAEIPLVGVLRSPLIGCSDTGLLLLSRLYRDVSAPRFASFRELLTRVANDTSLDDSSFDGDDLRALRKASTLLDRWQTLADSRGIAELIAAIIEDSGAYAPLSVGSDGDQRRLNVEKFIAVAREFEAQGAPTLAEFVRHLNMRAEGEDDEGDADLPEGGSIQLLTVHRAKGLQWSLVILPDTNGRFRDDIEERRYQGGRRLRSRIAVGSLRKGGASVPEVAVNLRSDEENATEPYLWSRLRMERRRRMLAEQKRLLYVAFTRAAEHLVICTHRNAKSDIPSLDKARSWADWIHQLLDDPSVVQDGDSFFLQTPLDMSERVLPNNQAMDTRSVAFDSSRIWSKRPPAPLRYRITDEPVEDRAQTPVHPSIGIAEQGWTTRARINQVSNLLLPIAWRGDISDDELRQRIRSFSRASGAILPDGSATELVGTTRRVIDRVNAEYADADRILWNEAFEVEIDGITVVGQIDMLVRDTARRWTAIDARYGDAPEPRAYQASLLRDAARAILGDPDARLEIWTVSEDGARSIDLSSLS